MMEREMSDWVNKKKKEKNPYLDSADIGVLSNILVLVETIFGGFSLAQINRELDKQYHHGFQGCDRAATSPLRRNMFVKNRQGSRRLADGDEFPGPLYIMACGQHRAGNVSLERINGDGRNCTLRTFSGLI